jgi:hypothetical protein
MGKQLQPSVFLAALLRPIIRFCLRQGLRIKELEECVRKALVEEARTTIEDAGGEVSVSKISVITGIHRVEVSRLLAGEQRPRGKHDVLTRVIGLWSQSAAYRDKSGAPRLLTFQGLESEFAALVARVSREVSHYPLLFELERIGAIEYKNDLVKLTVVEYTPSGDAEHGLEILGEEIGSLIETVRGNLTDRSERPDLHLRTSYDNIPPEHLEEIRAWVLQRGAAFQTDMRDYLSAFDRDINPEVVAEGGRAKVSVSISSLGRSLDQVKQLKPKRRGRKRASRSDKP